MLSFERLVALVLIGLFVAGAGWALRSSRVDPTRIPWLAVVAGLVAARTGFVALHWTAYKGEPLSSLYLWQGGFWAPAGMAAALATLLIALGWKRRLAGPAVILATASLAWFGYVQLDRAGPREAFPASVPVTNLAGQPVDLDSLRGRPFVVNLWATWCPPCRREMPMLAAAAHETRDVPILLVNQGEHPDLIRDFLRTEGLHDTNVLSDRAGVLLRRSSGAGLPTTLFVRADGKIDHVYVGELSRAALSVGIARVKGAPPERIVK
ncbi:redoxin domain-containing protein [Hephaestia sp. GCM10023244]|uniref:TlpA family protein disulfide reductase n=1 Tax=unclassified Hephaestia TaxID=2631281 RepID=UPI0020773F2B|nr:TlpA family protein disulfide reductase [Hephaestia sp. MAHUQ-44]MCM8729370.1 TlpA family protein disulfide reductase [Hephaestia sp. MAHUQ-44]